MKKLLSMSLILAASAANAQSLTPKSMQKKPVAAAPLTRQGAADNTSTAPISAEKMELAKQLNHSLTRKINYEQTMQTVAKQYVDKAKKEHPETPQEKLDLVYNNFLGITAKYKNNITEDNSKVLAQEFNENELRQIVAFNNSPVGQKMGEKTGEIAREVISGQSMPMEGVNTAINDFSLDEMQQIKTFYESPVGEKMQEKIPAMSQKMQANTNKYMQLISNDVDAMATPILGYHVELE